MATCPLSGMAPFIETEEWQHFHTVMTVECARQIGPQLPDYYEMSAELVVADRDETEELIEGKSYRPDIGITEASTGEILANETDTTVLTVPTKKYLRQQQPKQRHLILRDRHGDRIVTAIEVLSPANKGYAMGDKVDRPATDHPHSLEPTRSAGGIESAARLYGTVLVQHLPKAYASRTGRPGE